MENVLLYIIFYALVRVIALIRHVHMQKCLACCFQFSILFGTDSKLSQGNLEIEQVTRQVLRLEEESSLTHTELLANAILQLGDNGNHQIGLHQRKVASYLCVAHRIED